MSELSRPDARNAAETKSRIIAAAQDLFAEKGYPHAGMREIAARAGVATSLLTKYFGQKARLFEEALTGAILPPEAAQADRARFGAVIAETMCNQQLAIRAPAMMALSLGDAEARAVVVRVAREIILASMVPWLGPPHAEARAVNILMMTMGFAIFGRHMDLTATDTAQHETAEFFAQSLQRMVGQA